MFFFTYFTFLFTRFKWFLSKSLSVSFENSYIRSSNEIFMWILIDALPGLVASKRLLYTYESCGFDFIYKLLYVLRTKYILKSDLILRNVDEAIVSLQTACLTLFSVLVYFGVQVLEVDFNFHATWVMVMLPFGHKTGFLKLTVINISMHIDPTDLPST